MDEFTTEQLVAELRKRTGVICAIVLEGQEILASDLFGSRVFVGPLTVLEVPK